MTTEEHLLRRVFHDVTPALPQPEDRVAAVGARVRRTHRVVTAAALTTTAAAIALVVGIPAVLSGSNGSGGTSLNTAAGASTLTAGCGQAGAAPAGQADLTRTADELQKTAQVRFADSFGQVAQGPGRVLVYRKPSAALDEWIRSTFADRCVELVDTRYSAAEIDGIRTRVRADHDYWESRGIKVNATGVDAAGTITFGVEPGQVEKAKEVIPAHYDLPVVVQPRSRLQFK